MVVAATAGAKNQDVDETMDGKAGLDGSEPPAKAARVASARDNATEANAKDPRGGAAQQT